MKALFFDTKLELRDVPMPKPQDGEALLKVSMAGICKTDIEIFKGYMGFTGVPGHEFVGIVEESPTTSLIGSRVTAEINCGCGGCSWCLQGLERHCPDRTVIGILGRNGAMAEYITVPEKNLVRVSDKISDEKAVFIEPIAAAMEILEQLKINPNYEILVIGDGKLGLLIAQVLRLTGCDPILVGKHPEKTALYSGTVLTPSELEPDSRLFDVVVEASGSPSGWTSAMNRVKSRGTIVLKSTYHGDMNFHAAPLVVREINVIGSRCGKFEPAVRLLEAGLIDPSPMISGIFSIDQALEAFERSQDKDCLKILIRFP